MEEPNLFVVQEHRAKRAGLHHDFRLEHNGVLLSWAIPKCTPMVPGVKRLAIRVSDHPLGYATFEGVIPRGYGEGTVRIFDQGIYDTLTRTPTTLLIHLHGDVLQGRYYLKRMWENQWLIWKA